MYTKTIVPGSGQNIYCKSTIFDRREIWQTDYFFSDNRCQILRFKFVTFFTPGSLLEPSDLFGLTKLKFYYGITKLKIWEKCRRRQGSNPGPLDIRGSLTYVSATDDGIFSSIHLRSSS